MASSLVTGAETLTFARRKTSSSKLSLSGLLALKRVFLWFELEHGSREVWYQTYQLIRLLGSSKRSIVEEEGGSLLFPIVGDGLHVSAGRKTEFQVATKGGSFNLEFLGRMVVE